MRIPVLQSIGVKLPPSIDDALNGRIVREEIFHREYKKLSIKVMQTKQQYGRDIHQNVVKLGDFLGRYESGNFNVYVVCAESRGTFYLARYSLLQNFIDDNIDSIADIRNACSGQVLKQNCGKAVRLEAESINEVIRDQMIELQEKIREFYNG